MKNTVAIHPGFDTSTDPVSCTGTPSTPSPLTLITDAAPDTEFTYANAGGRSLDVAAGTITPGVGTKPAGVTDAAWSSARVAAVGLETTIAHSTDLAVDYRFAQTADNLSQGTPAADADTHFVPEGDITSIP